MPTVSVAQLVRASGLAALLAGALYIVIQFVHPREDLAAVSTDAWAVAGGLTFAMAVLALVGLAGSYLSQAGTAGVAGLLGFGSLAAFYLLTMAFSFAETLILPLLPDRAPNVVVQFQGLFNGAGTDGSLGALDVMPALAGALYVLGGVLFGGGLLRARVVPRALAVLFIGAALAPALTLVLPHQAGRFAAVPLGLALIWLGWTMLAGRSAPAADPAGGP